MGLCYSSNGDWCCLVHRSSACGKGQLKRTHFPCWGAIKTVDAENGERNYGRGFVPARCFVGKVFGFFVGDASTIAFAYGVRSDPLLFFFFFSGRIDDKVQAVRVPPRREIACSSVAVGGGGLSRGIRRDSASGADRQSWPAGRGCRAVFTSDIQTLCHTNVYI